VDAIMVHYVLSGTHYLAIEGHDPILCSAGSIVLIPRALQARVSIDECPAMDVPATGCSTLTREGLLMIDATVDGESDLRYVSGIVLASHGGSVGLFDNLTRPVAQHLGEHDIVRHAFALMVQEVGKPNLGARALTSALMKTCLVLLIRQTLELSETAGSMFGALSDPRLSKAVAAVLDQPAHPHTLESMADIAGMSRSTFCRAFVDAFGIAPKEFVTKTRLHRAAKMLRSTPLPIKTITGMVGFLSRSHFSRAFHAAYAVDPTEFRTSQMQRPTEAPSSQ
jgi:transcriptional regulator GlxA family with amidase domain